MFGKSNYDGFFFGFLLAGLCAIFLQSEIWMLYVLGGSVIYLLAEIANKLSE